MDQIIVKIIVLALKWLAGRTTNTVDDELVAKIVDFLEGRCSK